MTDQRRKIRRKEIDRIKDEFINMYLETKTEGQARNDIKRCDCWKPSEWVLL